MTSDDEQPFQFLRVEQQDQVLTVHLARPPVNSVDVPMYRELRRLFAHVDRRRPDVHVIVLAADGPHFCAGNDLDEFMTMDGENARERMFEVREAFFAIQDCAVPVVAAVQGAALGTGLAIAASCDLVVASTDARFGLPELTVGVMGGARHLARLAPQPFVRQLFLLGEPVDAEEMWRVGAIAKVVPRDELLPTAHEMAAKIARHSPTAIRVGKHVLDQIETMDLRAGYELEQSWTGWMSDHPDSKEAIRAAREKRPARYGPVTFGSTSSSSSRGRP